MPRAAAAGNMQTRSGVAVKITEMRSALSSALRSSMRRDELDDRVGHLGRIVGRQAGCAPQRP